MNLTILLLASRTYLTKERIRQAIEDYREGSDEAFEKKFERDKDELRAMGVPVELGSADAYFDDEQGYRIRRDAFELPAVEFDAEEAAVLGLAARVWQHAGLAATTSDALVKLRAAGVPVDREVLAQVEPRLVAEEPAFEPMWQATLSRTPVSFDYRRPGDTEPARRHLQPWGVATAQERWYVVGLDTDRGEARMFRLSRVLGEIREDGPAGSFSVPEGTDVHELTRSLVPSPEQHEATLLVRTGRAHGLRRRGRLLAEEVPGPDGLDAWDRITVPTADLEQFAGDVAAFGDAAVVESPARLRELVVGRLRDLVGTP